MTHAEYMRLWRAKNPEKWAEIARKARRKWKANNRDAHREAQRNHRYTVRKEIMDLLGGQRCVRCGFADDWRALQIDHIHSDGRIDRNYLTTVESLWAFRRKLSDLENLAFAKTKYQVLCANCNRIKVYENREFPGQAPIVELARLARRRTKAQLVGKRRKARQFSKIADGFK